MIALFKVKYGILKIDGNHMSNKKPIIHVIAEVLVIRNL